MEKITEYLEQMSKQLWLVIIFLIVIPPLGIYLLWKGNHFDAKKRKIISVISALWFVLYLVDASMEPSYQSGDCSGTFYEGGCTYFRDDNCNVVAKSCD